MKTYSIVTPYGTHYKIDECGCFLEYNEHKWQHPHDSWRCNGIAELRPFGNLKMHSLSTFFKMIENKESFLFKNGKPRYTLTDIDHGTFRVHGNTEHHGICYTEVSHA